MKNTILFFGLFGKWDTPKDLILIAFFLQEPRAQKEKDDGEEKPRDATINPREVKEKPEDVAEKPIPWAELQQNFTQVQNTHMHVYELI